MFTLALDVCIVHCTNLPDTNMLPCALARLKPTAVPRKPRSMLDSLLNALRNAKELAIEVGRSASTGWPLWWLQDVVLLYGARLDDISISDALSDPDVPAYRYTQLSRTLCLQQLQTTFDDFCHLARACPLRRSALHTSVHLCWSLCGLWPLSQSSSMSVALRQFALQKASSGSRTPAAATISSLGATSFAERRWLYPILGPRGYTPPMAKSMLANALNFVSLNSGYPSSLLPYCLKPPGS